MTRSISVTVVSIIAAAAASTALAQTGAATMRPFEDLPDWSGVWTMTSNTVFDQATVEPPGGNANTIGTREYPPYNDAWAAKYAEYRARDARGELPDPITTCGTPVGYPRMMNQPGAMEFVLRPEQVWLLSEDGPNVMRIYTDGRSHPAPADRWPTFMGESVGHWEGDTLVFETISLLGEGSSIVDRTGIVLSDEARITTRMRLVEDDLLEAAFAIEDPVAFTDTWHVVKQYRRHERGERIIEFACAQNNRNPVDAQGRTLTLDAEGNVLDEL
jgi:hypothetical protein